jgi:hypothetical protein
MAQPGRDEIECRLPIRERADDAGLRLISRRMRSSGLLSGMCLLVPLSIPPGLRISAIWVGR